MKQNQQSKKPLPKGCTIAIAIFAVIFVIYLVNDKSSSSNDSSNTTAIADEGTFIPGLPASDVYLNLQKQGFTVQKLTDDGGTGIGMSYVCKMKVDNFNYTVSTLGPDEDHVKSVEISTTAMPPNNAYEATSFYEMIGSTPYDGSNAPQAQQWLLNNIKKDGANTIIGGVKWTIYTKTKYSTIIMLERAE